MPMTTVKVWVIVAVNGGVQFGSGVAYPTVSFAIPLDIWTLVSAGGLNPSGPVKLDIVSLSVSSLSIG